MGPLAWPVTVVLAVNLTILTFIGLHAPTYLTDYRLNTNSDAIHYIRLGENFWKRGVYSRQDGPPYVPDVHRTPLYPLIAGGITSSTGVIWPLYVLQVLAQVGTVVAVVGLVSLVGSSRMATIAGVAVALDVASAIGNWQALSEPIFVFLSTMTVFLWARLVIGSRQWALWGAIAVGLLAGGAALTRPQGLYLGVLLALLLLARGVLKRGGPQLWAGAAMALGLTVVVTPWIVRNYISFGVTRLSTIDSLTLTYYAGAGVYQLRDGIDARTAESRIAHEFGLPPKNVAHNYWLTTRTPQDLDRDQQSAARVIFSKYPGLFLASGALGVLQAAFSHNTPELAAIVGREWNAPGLRRLLGGHVASATAELVRNGAVLASVFLVEVIFAPLLWLMAAVGTVRGLSQGRSQQWVLVGLLVAMLYYAASITVRGIGADARFRAPIVPLACALAGLSLRGRHSGGERQRPRSHRSETHWTGQGLRHEGR